MEKVYGELRGKYERKGRKKKMKGKKGNYIWRKQEI